MIDSARSPVFEYLFDTKDSVFLSKMHQYMQESESTEVFGNVLDSAYLVTRLNDVKKRYCIDLTAKLIHEQDDWCRVSIVGDIGIKTLLSLTSQFESRDSHQILHECVDDEYGLQEKGIPAHIFENLQKIVIANGEPAEFDLGYASELKEHPEPIGTLSIKKNSPPRIIEEIKSLKRPRPFIAVDDCITKKSRSPNGMLVDNISSTEEIIKNRLAELNVIKVKKTSSNVKEAEFPTLEGTLIIDQDAKIVDESTGRVVAYFLKDVLPKDKVEEWTEKFKGIPQNNSSRGKAAGPIDERRLFESTKKDYKKINDYTVVAIKKNGEQGNFRKHNNLRTTNIGFNATSSKNRGMYGEDIVDNLRLYKTAIEPFANQLSEYYKIIAPEWYEQQKRVIDGCKIHIGDSIFTNGAFNRGEPNTEAEFKDSQTACHVDENHSHEGYEVFAVLGKDIQGGELIFPNYQCALKLKEGDLILMKGKEDLHGNAPLLNGLKLSVIFYVHINFEKFKPTKEFLAELENHEGTPIEGVRDVYEKDKLFHCGLDSCDKTFTQEGNAERHMRKVHHVCVKCHKIFNSTYNAVYHNRKEHKTKTF